MSFQVIPWLDVFQFIETCMAKDLFCSVIPKGLLSVTAKGKC